MWNVDQTAHSRPRLAQISDPHVPGVGEPQRAGTGPAGHLHLAVEHASRRCDAILLNGDLAAHAGSDAEYGRLADVLSAAAVSVWLGAGNHGAPARLRERFSLPGTGGHRHGNEVGDRDGIDAGELHERVEVLD